MRSVTQAWTLHENVGQTYDTNLPYGHHLSIVAPDFVNVSPKLRFAVREAEKWFDCEVLLRQEECLSEVSPILWHPYSDCRDCFGCLKHLIHTHPNLVNSNESLQFLIYFIGDEVD